MKKDDGGVLSSVIRHLHPYGSVAVVADDAARYLDPNQSIMKD
jgi:hypothetical protein